MDGASTSASTSASPSSSNLSKQIVFERSEISSSASPHQGLVSQNSTPNEQSEIKTVLALKETGLLLKHCKLVMSIDYLGNFLD